jgi:hypothetical protein
MILALELLNIGQTKRISGDVRLAEIWIASNAARRYAVSVTPRQELRTSDSGDWGSAATTCRKIRRERLFRPGCDVLSAVDGERLLKG